MATAAVVAAVVSPNVALGEPPVVQSGEATLVTAIDLDNPALNPTTTQAQYARVRLFVPDSPVAWELSVKPATRSTSSDASACRPWCIKLTGSAFHDFSVFWDGRDQPETKLVSGTRWQGPWAPPGTYTLSMKLTSVATRHVLTAQWTVTVKTTPVAPQAPPPPKPVKAPVRPFKTPAQIAATLKANPLAVNSCPSGCSVNAAGQARGYVQLKVRVLTATVRGLGKPKKVNGKLSYQLFDVRVCALDYLQGGAKVGARLLYHTGTPPSTTAINSALEAKYQALKKKLASGQGGPDLLTEIKKIAAKLQAMQRAQTAAAPFAEDYQTHGLFPVIHSGC